MTMMITIITSCFEMLDKNISKKGDPRDYAEARWLVGAGNVSNF